MVPNETAIRALVMSNIETYAQTFSDRHIRQFDDPDGVLNMKIHNVFISALGEEILYYTALVRSLDSSLGNMLETLAINIAKLFYDVAKNVEGSLYSSQTSKIAELLEAYKNSNNPIKPSVSHYQQIKDAKDGNGHVKVHQSDYCLYDKETNTYYLIELKIGGDLDNKKARSEKEALMEQFAILSNEKGDDVKVKCYFATAYNRFGEGKQWNQGRVKQFFSNEELLIGRDFWNFICKSEDGYNIIIDEYKKNSHFIKSALNEIKNTYLK
jgi:hypothetical protein